MKRIALLLLVTGLAIGCGRSHETPAVPDRPSPPVAAVAPAITAPNPVPAAAQPARSRLKFRELSWGDPLPGGFKLLSQQSSTEAAYFDPKEQLSVAGVPVLDLSYRFIEGRFSAIAVQGAPANYPALVETLKKKWGAPVEEDPGRLKWLDSETTALLALAEPGKPFVLIVIDNAAVARAQPK